MQISRVIDLIANLQNTDPVAPVEVWLDNEDGTNTVFMVREVFQANSIYLKANNKKDPRQDKSGPFPVVVKIG